MEIRQVSAVYAHDAPWFHPWTKRDYRVVARQGLDGEPPAMGRALEFQRDL